MYDSIIEIGSRLPMLVNVNGLIRRNGMENTKMILECFEEVVNLYPELKWSEQSITGSWGERTGLAYYDHWNMRFVFILGRFELHRDNIRFLVFHEVGHFVDCCNGRLKLAPNTFLFEDKKVDTDHLVMLIAKMDVFVRNGLTADDSPMIKEANQLWSDYGSLPHELSANAFAAAHTTRPTNDFGLGIFYDQGKSSRYYTEINKGKGIQYASN